MAVEAAIYDLDGTIIDTNALHVASLNHVGQRFGFTVTSESYAPLKGLSTVKTLEALLPSEAHKVIPEAAEMRTRYLREHVGEVGILGNFVEAYDLLTRRKVTVAVCTSARQEFVDAVLQNVPALRGLKGKIVCKEMFKEGKPSAEPLLVTLKHLGDLAVKQALYVGDAHADYGSASNAGMDFVYFRDPASPDDERIPQTVPRIQDHREVVRFISQDR